MKPPCFFVLPLEIPGSVPLVSFRPENHRCLPDGRFLEALFRSVLVGVFPEVFQNRSQDHAKLILVARQFLRKFVPCAGRAGG